MPYKMPLEWEPKINGLRLASERLTRHNIGVLPTDFLEPVLDMTADVVAEGEPLPDRAIEFLVESVAIAATMRYWYSEEPLTEADLRSYLAATRGFLNSFVHL